jgi:hypothetical protein
MVHRIEGKDTIQGLVIDAHLLDAGDPRLEVLDAVLGEVP